MHVSVRGCVTYTPTYTREKQQDFWAALSEKLNAGVRLGVQCTHVMRVRGAFMPFSERIAAVAPVSASNTVLGKVSAACGMPIYARTAGPQQRRLSPGTCICAMRSLGPPCVRNSPSP